MVIYFRYCRHHESRLKASFTAPGLSSRGGLSLMREYDRQTGFPAPVNKHVEDDRCSYLVKHPCGETVTQRACRMASGYEDADGCGLLRYGRRNKTANITGILIRMTGLV